MKPHPRIRKTIKWGGAAVTVLLVVVWVGSGKLRIGHRNAIGREMELSGGQISYDDSSWMFSSSFVVPGWYCYTRPMWNINWRLWSGSVPWQPFFGRWRAPLWPLCIFSACLGGFAWRLDTLARRRAKLNLCPKCGYDRTGILKDAKCPECGSGGTPA